MHSRPYLDFFLLPLWRCSRRKCQKMNDREKRSAFVSSWQIEPNRTKSKETLRISFRMPNAKWPADRQRQLVRPSLYPPQPRPLPAPRLPETFAFRSGQEMSHWPHMSMISFHFALFVCISLPTPSAPNAVFAPTLLDARNPFFLGCSTLFFSDLADLK